MINVLQIVIIIDIIHLNINVKMILNLQILETKNYLK